MVKKLDRTLPHRSPFCHWHVALHCPRRRVRGACLSLLAFALVVNDAGPIARIEDVREVFAGEAAITSAIEALA